MKIYKLLLWGSQDLRSQIQRDGHLAQGEPIACKLLFSFKHFPSLHIKPEPKSLTERDYQKLEQLVEICSQMRAKGHNAWESAWETAPGNNGHGPKDSQHRHFPEEGAWWVAQTKRDKKTNRKNLKARIGKVNVEEMKKIKYGFKGNTLCSWFCFCLILNHKYFFVILCFWLNILHMNFSRRNFWVLHNQVYFLLIIVSRFNLYNVSSHRYKKSPQFFILVIMNEISRCAFLQK